uniref:Ig-like domain-containing protein n=1 Tax=Ailuropoda melanoleuca TaxID=9646 RepID=A0A7N5JAS5_AILME
MPLLEAVIFSCLWAFGLGQVKLEQPEISISRARDKSAHISCKVFISDFNNAKIHWYRQKPDQEIEHLTYIQRNKTRPCTTVPAGIGTRTGWIKVFAHGTKLIVTPPDRNLDADLSPKPTIFFPSIAERELQKAGTYLCLLEDFFPDVIKTDWQEKDDKTILTSQQGDAIKTNDTYMKFSWLTVTGASLDKEHKCIVKHERNKGGVDQEILFSSHIKGMYMYIYSRTLVFKGNAPPFLLNMNEKKQIEVFLNVVAFNGSINVLLFPHSMKDSGLWNTQRKRQRQIHLAFLASVSASKI